MFTEEEMTKSNNRTPVGLASWCWGARINYVGYQTLAAEQGIAPLNKAEFTYIQNWWNEQWSGFSGIKA